MIRLGSTVDWSVPGPTPRQSFLLYWHRLLCSVAGQPLDRLLPGCKRFDVSEERRGTDRIVHCWFGVGLRTYGVSYTTVDGEPDEWIADHLIRLISLEVVGDDGARGYRLSQLE